MPRVETWASPGVRRFVRVRWALTGVRIAVVLLVLLGLTALGILRA